MQFQCKQFSVHQSDKVFKITTDSMLLGALAGRTKCTRTVLDIIDLGTGTGIISLMMAQRFPLSNITGMDLNKDAVDLANRNFQSSIFSNNLEARQGNFTSWDFPKKYDLVLSNPPYFVNNEPSKTQHNSIAKHTSVTYQQLIHHFAKYLKQDGELALIFPSIYKNDVIDGLKKESLRQIEILNIHRNPNKAAKLCISCSSYASTCSVQSNNFFIRDEGDNYSDDYAQLMKDFLLIF